MRLLAVDDDPGILELLENTLEAFGWDDVVAVSSGKEALPYLSNTQSPIECFLVDIQMPEMDGIELCAHIRRHNHHKNTPILMITAMSDKDYVDRAFAAGATDYVTKPFSLPDLEMRLMLTQQQVIAELHETNGNDAGLTTEFQTEAWTIPSTQEFDFAAIDRFLDYLPFENYVSQLSRLKLLFSGVQSAIVVDEETGENELSPGVLHAIAEQFSRCTQLDNCLFTYSGDGCFLTLCSQMDKSRIAEIEQELQNACSCVTIDGRNRNVRIVFGDYIPLPVLNKTASITSLDRAVLSAAEKAEMRVEIDHFFHDRHEVNAHENQKNEEHCSVYKEILDDFLGASDSVDPLMRNTQVH
jgi:CheY-like chemotaxis protein